MAMLARLGVVLGLDSAEFQQGIEAAGKKIDALASKLPAVGAAGAAAFVAMTYAAMKYADELSDTAKANDMAVSSILKLQHALMLNGGEAENAGKMLASFSNFVDKAASGNQEAQDSFAKMGISLKDLAKLSQEDLFNKVAQSISQIDDVATRNAKAMDAFGKAAKGVDFKSFNDDLQHGIGLNEEWTKSINDAADAYDMLGAKHHEFMTQFTAAIGTNLKLALEYFDQVFQKSTLVFDAVKTVFQTVVVVASDVVFVIKSIAEEIENIIKVSKTMATEGIAAAGKIRDEYLERKARERQELDFFQQRIMGMGVRNPDDPRRLDRPAAAKAQAAYREVKESPEAKRQREMLAMAKLISIEYERHLQFNYENLKVKGQMAFMTENEKKLQEAINSVADDVDKKLTEIQKKREEAAAHGASRKVLDELDAQAEAVRKLGEQYKTLTEIEMKQQIAEQSTFSYGWDKAFKQYVEDSQNAAKLGQGYFETMTGAMSNAIDTFVQTGKFSFQDFTTSIIKNIIAMEMKMQAMQLFRMGMSAMGFTVPAAKADGGFVGANTPYMVGERGPELFIPQGAGTIIPSNRSMDSAQPAPQVIYNGPYIANMSAIDTQSATQFLAKNKSTIWAVNQSAQRSLPVSK